MLKRRLDKLAAKTALATVDAQERALLTIIRNHESQLVDLNTMQLMRGENAEGGLLGLYRSKAYAEFKEILNPEAHGAVDTKLTGAFHQSFFLVADKFPVVPYAKDPKTKKLTEQYDGIFGFSPNSKKEISEDLREEIQDYYKSLLQV